MRNFAFSLMELLQRTDAALTYEHGRERPDRLKLIWLKRRRRQLAERLRRSFGSAALAGA